MTTMVTRAAKGSSLTWGEVDANFTNLNENKVETINPTSSGTLTHSGDIVLSGSGKRLTGDFSNATISNRVMFQTTSANNSTAVGALPNGSGANAHYMAFSTADPANCSFAMLSANYSNDTRLSSDKTGAGTYLPMTFYTGGSERMRIDTSGNVGIGGAPSGSRKFEVISSGTATDFWVGNTNGFGVQTHWDNISGYGLVCTVGGYPLKLGPNSTAVLSIDNNANTLHIHPNGGLGYGTGAGGTVTQATSKSTAVALNKPTGQITMNNAALAANTRVVFQVNNNLVTADDIVVATYVDDFGTQYRVDVQAVWTGYFQIGLTNVTAGSLSHVVRINFAIIKGASS